MKIYFGFTELIYKTHRNNLELFFEKFNPELTHC